MRAFSKYGYWVGPYTALIFGHTEAPRCTLPYKMKGVGLIRKGDILDLDLGRESRFIVETVNFQGLLLTIQVT